MDSAERTKQIATRFAAWFKLQGAYTTQVDEYFDRWIIINDKLEKRAICKKNGHKWRSLEYAYNGSSFVCEVCEAED